MPYDFHYGNRKQPDASFADLLFPVVCLYHSFWSWLKYSIDIIENSRVQAIEGKRVIISRQGKNTVVEADTIVLAMGAVPNNSLVKRLRNRLPRLYAIGDCASLGKIVDAINQASYIGRQI